MTFDLEKARAEVATASARRFSESREQARIFCAEEILPDALDEIERLRPFEIAARDLDSDLTKIAGERDDQAARIKELDAEAQEYHDRAEELATKLAKSWQITDEKRDAIEKAAHICHEVTAFDVAATLRAMLQEAGQE